ncbi:uncharacterized membrane protein YobD (UPF0266 family) [Paenibacillus amylolyticus]|uniref:Uncharacterized membrane protein YobD (UPF0266 family) n=1 Tax=Paenibacillus amylolyticus TaxID=1451 RepID=A0AAP5H809_PAEAM|nr:hypothetical protein [Paenibacillus amylolyticus]MDR6726910.1 uncharacterized membrane protein YobD (UPF0266 family) [Paenibacillus amylolyticus]
MNYKFMLKGYPLYYLFIFLPIGFLSVITLLSNYIGDGLRVILLLTTGLIVIALFIKNWIDSQKEYTIVLLPEGITVNKTNYSINQISEMRIGTNLLQIHLLDQNKKLSFSLKSQDKDSVIKSFKAYCENAGIKAEGYRRV